MSTATVGSALSERRKELGLAKGQAADKIGMSRTTYSSYEQDAQRPSVEVFPTLAKFLNISIEDLLVLYGATCVAAVRSALQRLVSTPQDENEGSGDPEVSPSVNELPKRGLSGTSYERFAAPSQRIEAMLTPSEHFESVSTLVIPDVSKVAASDETPEAEAIQEEPAAPSEQNVRAVEPTNLSSAMYQHSPLAMKAPKFESREQGSGNKKKKKKKRKKN